MRNVTETNLAKALAYELANILSEKTETAVITEYSVTVYAALGHDTVTAQLKFDDGNKLYVRFERAHSTVGAPNDEI